MQEFTTESKTKIEAPDLSKIKFQLNTAAYDEPETYPESIFMCYLTTKTGNVLQYKLKVDEFHLTIVSQSGSVKADYHLADIIITGDEKVPRKAASDSETAS